MQIIKPTEPIPVDHPIFLLFGEPGTGKSTLGYSGEHPLVLDFDGGAHRAKNRRGDTTPPLKRWADVPAMDEASLKPYQTLVIDTVGRCLDVLTTEIIRENPKLGNSGNLTQQGWGSLKQRFRTWMATVRSYDKDIILLAHQKEERDNDLRIVRPDITGGSYSEVMKIADFVGFLYMSGGARLLDFSPTDRWPGKNPAQWPPLRVPPVAEAGTFLADLIVKGRAALGAISEDSAATLAAVERWKQVVKDCQSAADFSRLLPDLKKAEKDDPDVYAQARHVLNAATKARGITYDDKTKKFVDPEPAEATA